MNSSANNYLAELNHHHRDDHIEFDEGPHIYTIKGQKGYTSVTTWNHSHFKKFNADNIIDKIMNGNYDFKDINIINDKEPESIYLNGLIELNGEKSKDYFFRISKTL